MKLHTTRLLSAVLLAAAPASWAEEPLRTPPPGPSRNPFGNGDLPEILKPFDVNGDGKLSEEERQAYVNAVHDANAALNGLPRPVAPPVPGQGPGAGPPGPPPNPWDTDGDGKLSDAERAAAQEAIRARIIQERSDRFDEIDKDDDGFLDSEEFLGIPGMRSELAARILENLDKDSDGLVSKDEFLASLAPPVPPTPPDRPNPPDRTPADPPVPPVDHPADPPSPPADPPEPPANPPVPPANPPVPPADQPAPPADPPVTPASPAQ